VTLTGNIISTYQSLIKRIYHRKCLLSNFTLQWIFVEQHQKRNIHVALKQGRVRNEGTACCLWKLARILELLPGKDKVSSCQTPTED